MVLEHALLQQNVHNKISLHYRKSEAVATKSLSYYINKPYFTMTTT